MIISKTPIRISLCGGGSDIPIFYKQHTGRVISCAINKYVYVIIKERFDNLIVLNYTKHEITEKVSDIKHDLIRECMILYGIERGIEISTIADIPSEGSGLGSSSAVTVGLLNAFAGYVGYPQTPQTLARFACDIEIDILKKPIGRQDQYACAYGGMGYFRFYGDYVDREDFNLTSYQYSQISNNLFLHYTGITRDANAILSDQNNRISDNIGGLSKLCELTEKLGYAILKEDYDMIGYAIKTNWEYKKTFANGITIPAINKMIDMAYRGGALGCKICGAGGGGFLLSYVPQDRQLDFLHTMLPYRELPFNIDMLGSRIIFNIQ